MAERAHPEDPGFQDKWWRLKKSPYRRRLLERYRFCNEWIRNKRVADIPCGVGWGTSMLRGAQLITGIDIAPDAVEYATQHFANRHLDFKVGSMSEIPMSDNSLDVVVCFEGFEHVAREVGSAFLAESKRVLQRDGLLLMTCPVLNEWGEDTGNPYHVCEYPEEELIEMINRNFRVLHLDRIPGPDGPEYRIVASNLGSSRYVERS